MKTPAVSDRVFELLSVLLDGKWWAFEEIRDVTDWQPTRDNFLEIAGRLVDRGLVRRDEFSVAIITRARCRKNVRRAAYAITDRGRELWAEKVDWFGFLLKRFGPTAKRTKQPAAKAGLRPHPRGVRPAGLLRRATPEDLRQLLVHAPHALAHLVRCLDLGVLPFAQLIALDVRDVDFREGVIRLRGAPRSRSTIRPGPGLLAALADAIGDRQGGPAVPAPRGGRWTANRAAVVFDHARRRAGLPNEIKLRARTTKQSRAVLSPIL